MKFNFIARTGLLFSLLTLFVSTAFSQGFEVPADSEYLGTLPAGGPYVPPGGLYDNEQSNGVTSLASQDSDSTFTARSADDFIITQSCASGQFQITSVRTQHVLRDSNNQALAIDFYNDDGTGNAPESGINPFATVSENSKTLLSPFGADTSIYEADFLPAGLILNSNTKYWISSFGTGANSGAFNSFFASSDGASSTTANSVIIAPGAGVADWTPVESVIGPPALAFSFAIDGNCVILPPEVIPALGSLELILAALMIAGIGLVSLRKFNKAK